MIQDAVLRLAEKTIRGPNVVVSCRCKIRIFALIETRREKSCLGIQIDVEMELAAATSEGDALMMLFRFRFL